MLLKSGDKLICTCVEGWEISETGADAIGPEFGDIVTVRAVGVELLSASMWGPLVWLEEFPGDTDNEAFQLQENFAVARS